MFHVCPSPHHNASTYTTKRAARALPGASAGFQLHPIIEASQGPRVPPQPRPWSSAPHTPLPAIFSQG